MFSFFEGIAAFISTIVNFVVNMFGPWSRSFFPWSGR